MVSKYTNRIVHVFGVSQKLDKIVAKSKLQNYLTNNNYLLKNNEFNILNMLCCSVKQYNILNMLYCFVKEINYHKVNTFSKNYGYHYFNYLLNRIKEYKLIYYIVVFVYSIYRNINKMLLTRQGFVLLFVFGILTGDTFRYYQYLYSLYIITLIKNYLESNKQIL